MFLRGEELCIQQLNRSLYGIDEETAADDEGVRLCCQEEKVPFGQQGFLFPGDAEFIKKKIASGTWSS